MSVIVDDNDPLVQYNGGWAHHFGRSMEFEVTTTSSLTPGDTATLNFEGTSIIVYGTVAPGQARMNVSIDGTELSPFDAPQVNTTTHNVHLWTSPVFTEAPHTLTLTVDHDTPSNINTLGTLFLDYFVYKTASPGGKTIFVDDSDSSVIYSPDWQTINDCDRCRESTQHVSSSIGSWVALNFEGSNISLNGSADGQQLFVLLDGITTQISTDKNNPQLFRLPVPPLENSRSHTMNITAFNGDPFAIDSFLITPTSQGVSGNTSVTGGGGDGVTGSLGPVPTPSSGSTNPQVTGVSTSKPPPIAAIVGGTVGSLVLLALILVAILMRKRWMKNRPNNESPFPVIAQWAGRSSPDPLVTTVRPFVPSLSGESAEPPPYTLKYMPLVHP
ncbi:hypothetical protein B0H19DRAFT_235901 [Mycena capillaripes]|nr:hypothetical protein B0H19DRAFT_235901 [Mycena capillaripes]